MFERAVLSSYLFVPLSALSHRQLDHYMNDLTAISKFNSETVIPMYKRTPGWFGFPVHYFQKNLQQVARSVVDKRSRGTRFRFKFTSTLRDSQVRVYNQFIQQVKLGETGFKLHAAPGFGKTVVMLQMAAMLKTTTLIVVHRSTLVDQWVQRIMKHTDITKDQIGIINGDVVKWQSRKIVVALVHSLAAHRFGAEFRRYFGAVFYDEVDRSVPPTTFAPVVGMMTALYRVGASAQMTRKDELHTVIDNHVGHCVLRGKAAKKGEIMKPKVAMVFYQGRLPTLGPRVGRIQKRSIFLSCIAKDPSRNMILANYINWMYKTGRKTVILSDRVEHLITLRKLSAKIGNIPLENTGIYARQVPSTTSAKKNGKRAIKDAELQSIARDCQLIFATYQLFAVGTDIQELSGLVYATPQTDVVQSKGRIERYLKGKLEPRVIDIVDTAAEGFLIAARSREDIYKTDGLEIKRLSAKRR